MCGICGIVGGSDSPPVSQALLERMNRVMTPRGPDQEGTFVSGPVGLGSRRLSIIDVVGGRQPISNETGSVQVVFNGEIYNHRELRAYLERKGHVFATRTDTEVIAHLYEQIGLEFIQQLNGIFAIAIWDADRRRLILARDRTGVKPLYYAEIRDQIVFGSEMKVLLQHPGVSRDLDLVALNEYLSLEFIPSPRTIVRGVARLEAGHMLVWDARGVRQSRYWNLSLARSEDRPPVKWRDYAAALRETLSQSVRKELVSDVPVGVLLSGGLDSSSIAALATAHYPGQLQTFSIGFDEASFDETRYAQLVADRLGTQHRVLTLTSRVAADLVPRIPDFLDEPFGDSSLIPTYLLSKFAREHVKVALGGDGSDELFAGYPTLAAHRLIEYYERLVPWRVRSHVVPSLLALMPVSFDNISLDFKIRRFLAGRGVSLEARHHRWMGSFTDEEKASLLSEWVKPAVRDTYAEVYRHARECDASLLLNRILYDDFKLYLEGDILFKVDRASMAASLEVRVPFLNNDVVDFATHLPLELKLRRLTGKFLLRQAMANDLPREILARSKKGFNMPVAHWLTNELKALTTDYLSPARLARQGLFDPAAVERLLQGHLSRTRDNRKQLWTLLVFQLWAERYLDGAPATA
jgi:asparagine synthase (glutamine-hydrolysing)